MENEWGCFSQITGKKTNVEAFLKRRRSPACSRMATLPRGFASLRTVNHSSLEEKGCGGRRIFNEEMSWVQVLRMVLNHRISQWKVNFGNEQSQSVLELPLLPSRTQSTGTALQNSVQTVEVQWV